MKTTTSDLFSHFHMPMPIRYTLRIPAPESHYLEIEAIFSWPEPKLQVELFLPVWTPGSYMVREYSRHIEAVHASLPFTKTRKNRWQFVSSDPFAELRIHYRLYCHELSVRTNFVDDQFALINGAATFLTAPDAFDCEYQVTLELPAKWQSAWSGMTGNSGAFTTPNYDSLVDSPIVAGNPAAYPFEAGGKTHVLLNVGEAGLWDGPKAVADLKTLIETHLSLWDTLPYEKYLFINLLTGRGGGLEHRNSSVLMCDRYVMRTHRTYLAWLDLASHEFFHVWNVKRLRPAELGPFDYENEVYTHNLWIAEGFTEYYGPLLLRRSGLSTDEEFLGTGHTAGQKGFPASLTYFIDELQRTPGRLEQPVAQASFDAWIRHYRPDENSPNVAISYYIKGALIAWLLDAKIRQATGDAKSLDDLMRLAFERYSGSNGFTDAQFCTTAQEVVGIHLASWFHEVAHTTAELDYTEALAWFGLRFRPAQICTKAYTGITAKVSEGRLLITHVTRTSPAAEAGLSPDDEILAIDGFRVQPGEWEQRLEQYSPGDQAAVLIARNDRILTRTLRLGQEPPRQCNLEIDPEATPEKKEHYRRWVSARRSA